MNAFLVSNAARQTQLKMITDIASDLFDTIMKTNIYAPYWIIKARCLTSRQGRLSLRLL